MTVYVRVPLKHKSPIPSFLKRAFSMAEEVIHKYIEPDIIVFKRPEDIKELKEDLIELTYKVAKTDKRLKTALTLLKTGKAIYDWYQSAPNEVKVIVQVAKNLLAVRSIGSALMKWKRMKGDGGVVLI